MTHALSFVLLLLPNTSLKDWQTHAGPNLRYVMQHGAVGLMNVRTAERDTITERASIRTIGAGARMGAYDNVTLPYVADANNLRSCFASARVAAFEGHEKSISLDEDNRAFLLDYYGSVTEADGPIGDWMKDPNCRLMVLSTNPSPAAYAAQDRLCPVAVYGQGVARGLLTSASTRTAGLVTNTDVAPTIAAYFGGQLRTPAFGVPMAVEPETGDLAASLASQNDSYIRQAKLIAFMPYVAGMIAALVAFCSWLILRKKVAPSPLAASIMMIPVAMLFTHPHPFLLIASAGVLGLALWKKIRLLDIVACLITALALVDALLHRGQFFGGSMLGYTPSEGARYYGVGNEVMGLWIGLSTYICCRLAAVSSKGRSSAIIIALAVIAALGLPGAGAKAGGFLVGLVTLAAALWTRTGRAVKPAVAAAMALAVLLVGAVALIAMGKLFGASHVTQAVGMVHSQGAAALGSVIWRKASMDAHLVFHSVWMLVLIATSAATFFAIRPIWRESDLPRAEIIALTTATAASLLLNDAGVVAAALCSLSLWASAMLARERFRTAEKLHSTT